MAYLMYIRKAAQPELPPDNPLERGKRIHKEVEAYIQGSDDFPSSGKKLQDVLDYCREHYADGNAVVEDQWAFDRDWSTTGWFDDTAWCRMITDCTIYSDEQSAEIYDWKTGKSFGNEVKYMQQMQLYAVGAFLKHPDMEILEVRLGFLDDGKVREKVFQRDKKIMKLMKRFDERGRRMTECVDFRPKPSPINCKYCPFGPDNGTGECVHGVSSNL